MYNTKKLVKKEMNDLYIVLMDLNVKSLSYIKNRIC